jgi:hypothetical protein
MEDSSHLHALAALLPGKSSWYQVERRGVDPEASLNMVTKRQHPFLAPGCQACNLVTILTELPTLHNIFVV